jgi:hypothetical protein
LLSETLVPDVRGVQVTPSGDVRIVPPVPTATKSPSPYVTPRRLLDITKDCEVQVIPSVEVMIAPSMPTATYVVPFVAIAFKEL